MALILYWKNYIFIHNEEEKINCNNILHVATKLRRYKQISTGVEACGKKT